METNNVHEVTDEVYERFWFLATNVCHCPCNLVDIVDAMASLSENSIDEELQLYDTCITVT